MLSIELPENKKIYFASDNHLGAPTVAESKPREAKFVQWLDTIKADAGAIFLLGDLFDLWMDDYFQTELNIPVYRRPLEVECNGKRFLIGHGDGLGPGDKGYKRMKKVFTNPFCKWLFRWLHPDIGVRLAQYLSVKNKLISGAEDVHFLGEDNEWLVQYCKRKLETQHYDYFLFGHRHLPMTIKVGEGSTYINTGDWIHYFTYAVFDPKTGLEIKEFTDKSTC